MKRIYFFLLLTTLYIQNVYAYIDPMSGSAILYVLFGLAAAVFFALRGLYYRFKNFFSGKGFIQSETMEGCNIVFYSEGKQYWPVFEPIIRFLDQQGIKTAYLSSEKSDPGLNSDYETVKKLYLGKPTTSIIYLNNISANIMVLTTPQLDILTLKRSRKVKHYAHVLHAPVDIHTYRKFAFDYFDSVFCSGDHQIKSIRYLEKKRGTPVKELYKTGLTYYDSMLEEINKFSGVKSDGKTVLIAPTWQPFNIINRYGSAPLKTLLNAGFRVILRPHPQTYSSFPEVVRGIEKDLVGCAKFTIDRNTTGIESMLKSDIMLSDLSGVIFDYLFLFRKPIIILNSQFDGGGMEGSELSDFFWDMEIIECVGKIIDVEDISFLPSIIEDEIKQFKIHDITDILDSSIYNFGKAGEETAKQLQKILKKIIV